IIDARSTMKRSALREFLRGIALMSIPVGGVAGCGNGNMGGGGSDMARKGGAAVDMAVPGMAVPDMAVVDMAVPKIVDMAFPSDLVDMCLYLPVVMKTFPYDGDGGMPNCFQVCEPDRPMNYNGFDDCFVVPTDGGQAIECIYSPCGFGRR